MGVLDGRHNYCEAKYVFTHLLYLPVDGKNVDFTMYSVIDT